jgi:tetratricopeptide (TPR) repeat protein
LPLAATGEFAQVSGMMEIAYEKPGQPVKRGTMAHEHDIMMQHAEAAAQQRDLVALQKYTPRLEQLAERDDHKLYQAIAQRAWGIALRLSGEYTEAELRLNRSLEIVNSLKTGWQIGRTHFEIAELHREKSELEEARMHYSAALESFEVLRAIPDIERTRISMETL